RHRWGRRGLRPDRIADLSAVGHAVAQRYGGNEHAAAQRAERPRRHAGHRHHGADSLQGGTPAWPGPGGDTPRERARRQGRIWADQSTHRKTEPCDKLLFETSAGRGREAVWLGRARGPATE